VGEICLNPENIKFYEVKKLKSNFLKSPRENSKIQFPMNIYICIIQNSELEMQYLEHFLKFQDPSRTNESELNHLVTFCFLLSL
jgi:hypothetical protein